MSVCRRVPHNSPTMFKNRKIGGTYKPSLEHRRPKLEKGILLIQSSGTVSWRGAVLIGECFLIKQHQGIDGRFIYNASTRECVRPDGPHNVATKLLSEPEANSSANLMHEDQLVHGWLSIIL